MIFKTGISLERQDSESYTLTKKDVGYLTAKSILVVAVLSYFFYKSAAAMLPLAVVGILFFRQQAAEAKKRNCELITLQFKECILSVTTALQAGYAVENAFLESRADMRMLFGEHSAIYRELEWMRRGMVMNLTLEELLRDLARRSKSEEIQQFSQVFAIAKRSGGNLSEVIRSSADLITSRIDTRQEIRTLLSGRKMEQTIMKVVPFAILTYIGFSYPGYFDGLYYNLRGILIMTGCLILYLAACILGEKIWEKIEKNLG